jgi:hypothetical protein
MEALGQRAWIETMVDARWRRVLDATGPQYSELTLEFLNTFQLCVSAFDDANANEFSLERSLHSMSIPAFAVHLGFYTEEETRQPIFTESHRGIFTTDALPGVTTAQLEEFWLTIADHPFFFSIPASHIRDLVFRFLHRIVACTILGRYMGIEKVSHIDLFVLYYLFQRRLVNLASVLIISASRPRPRGEGSRLALGPYITQLARSLRVFADYPAVRLTLGPPSALFRFEDMQQMRICPLDEPRRFFDVQVHQPAPAPAGDVAEQAQPAGAPPQRQPRQRARARGADQPPPPQATLDRILAIQQQILEEKAAQ